MKLYKIYAICVKLRLNNRGNFHLQLLRRFKDIAVFVVGSFSLPHPVDLILIGTDRPPLLRNLLTVLIARKVVHYHTHFSNTVTVIPHVTKK